MSKMTEYKKEALLIKKELGRFTTKSFLKNFTLLFRIDATGNHEFMKRFPWCCFLAFKWKSICGDSSKSKDANFNQFVGVINKIYGLQSKAESFEGDFRLVMRRFFMPQALYQTPMQGSYDALVRQYVWFCKSEDDFFKNEFLKEFGIQIDKFYKMAMLFFLWVFSINKESVKISYSDVLVSMHPAFSISEIKIFFLIIGVSITDIKSFANCFRNDECDEWEYFQDTPFMKKPIIMDEGFFHVPCVRVAVAGIVAFVPDFFKERYGSRYKESFGAVMESYVGRVLAELNAEVCDEGGVLSQYKSASVSGKVVDFIVKNESGSVFIDSKAIEPSGIVKTSKDPEVLKERLSGSYIKGVIQIESCASILRSIGCHENKEFDFGLVVTHKDHFISTGEKVAEGFFEEFESEIVKWCGEISIPLSRVYYITIDELELLVSVCNSSGKTMGEVISECEVRDRDKKKSKMNFHLHLLEYSSLPMDKFEELSKAGSEIFDSFQGAFESRTKFWNMNVGYFLQCYNEVSPSWK